MKKITILLASALGMVSVATAQDLPSNPQPGKCYVKCVTPDEYKTETVKIMVSPEYKKLTVVPAEYKTVEERIEVKPASKKYIYHPAVFETYTEEYESVQGYTKLAVVPATLKAGSETYVEEPSSAGWEYKDKAPNCTSPDPNEL